MGAPNADAGSGTCGLETVGNCGAFTPGGSEEVDAIGRVGRFGMSGIRAPAGETTGKFGLSVLDGGNDVIDGGMLDALGTPLAGAPFTGKPVLGSGCVRRAEPLPFTGVAAPIRIGVGLELLVGWGKFGGGICCDRAVGEFIGVGVPPGVLPLAP